jgi:hypothetical protein
LSISGHFPLRLNSELRKTGDVAAWARQAVDKSGGDGIAGDREYDWYSSRHLQQCSHCCVAMSQYYIRCERSQFRSMAADRIGIGSGPARVDPHITANDPT